METSKPHSELCDRIVNGLGHERPSYDAGLVALGELLEQLEALHYAADRLLATGLLGAVGWPSVSPEWKAEIEARVEALAKAVDAYPASVPVTNDRVQDST